MASANVELVQGAYAAFGRRDMADLARRVADDFVAEQSTELPWGGTYRGVEGLQRFFATLLSHVNSTLVYERFLDAGDHVVMIGWTRGTTVKGNQPFDVPVAHAWKIRDGKLIAFRPFIDNPTMLAALKPA